MTLVSGVRSSCATSVIMFRRAASPASSDSAISLNETSSSPSSSCVVTATRVSYAPRRTRPAPVAMRRTCRTIGAASSRVTSAAAMLATATADQIARRAATTSVLGDSFGGGRTIRRAPRGVPTAGIGNGGTRMIIVRSVDPLRSRRFTVNGPLGARARDVGGRDARVARRNELIVVADEQHDASWLDHVRPIAAASASGQRRRRCPCALRESREARQIRQA